MDIASDPNHCGACLAIPCLGITPGCCSGTCVDFSSNTAHCGACGTAVCVLFSFAVNLCIKSDLN